MEGTTPSSQTPASSSIHTYTHCTPLTHAMQCTSTHRPQHCLLAQAGKTSQSTPRQGPINPSPLSLSPSTASLPLITATARLPLAIIGVTTIGLRPISSLILPALSHFVALVPLSAIPTILVILIAAALPLFHGVR
mmetsp:Transcript_2039/g.5579  ORF Transcript_2039/g.5579 Transcript_2039/m.5579 type:complete len:136 (-) Transcript_2039:611-1018(-)